MDDIRFIRHLMQLTVTEILAPNQNRQEHIINQDLLTLEKLTDKYIFALAINDNITYPEFYDIIDILESNLFSIKQKIQFRK